MLQKEESSKPPKTKKRFIQILFWSLLVHLILLILVLLFAFKKSELVKFFKSLPAKQAKKNDLPASLKPRQSTFGTTVFFDDEPQFKKPKSKNLAETTKKGEEESRSPKEEVETEPPSEKNLVDEKISPRPITSVVRENSDEQKTESKKAPKENIEDKSARDEKLELEEINKRAEKINKIDSLYEKPQKIEPVQEVEKDIKTKSEEIKPKRKNESMQPILSEPVKEFAEKIEDKTQKRIEEIEKLQEKLDQVEQVKTQKIKNFGDAQKDKSPIQPPKRSIIAMTKGFVENLKHKGDDWLERKGDDNKRPSLEELKYLSYEQKINWHLQNCWKQNFARISNPNSSNGRAIIEFKIDLRGYVHDLILLQSSGNGQLDHMILQSVTLAAPFPPLPKHFEKNIYKTGRIIIVSQQTRGFRFNN